MSFLNSTTQQGCSLGLEHLGLEAVLRHFFGTSRLISVLKIEHLGLVSVLWLNVLWTSLLHRPMDFVCNPTRPTEKNPYMSRLIGQVYDQTKSTALSEIHADPTGLCRKQWYANLKSSLACQIPNLLTPKSQISVRSCIGLWTRHLYAKNVNNLWHRVLYS